MVETGSAGTALVTVPGEVSRFLHEVREVGMRDAWLMFMLGSGSSVTARATRATVFGHLVRISLDASARAGVEDGTRAGRWRFDGNTSRATYERCVRLDDDGDPSWHDEFGSRHEPLSGEWADELTVQGLLAFLGVDEVTASAEMDETVAELCTAYQDGFHAGYHDQVMGAAHYQLGTSGLEAARAALPDAGAIEVRHTYRVKVRFPHSDVVRYGEHAIHELGVDGRAYWFCETCGLHGPDAGRMGAARWHDTRQDESLCDKPDEDERD